jgi:uncharacterized protein
MRWAGGRRSGNIEDRRGMGVPLVAGGGIGTVVILVLALFFGFDPGVILNTEGPPTGSVTEAPPPSASTPTDTQKDFVSVVLADTEDTWTQLFRQMNREYRAPKLVLFRGAVQSACGMAGAAVGPFYCPPDRKVYLDLDFFRALSERFRAPGDFAQAYVIAHEVGHHVQQLQGTSDDVNRIRREDPDRANEALVRLELQADCYSGVWAQTVYEAGDLQPGDIEEALRASEAVGDDRLQSRAGRQVNPDSFTHGSSAQRRAWFERGRARGEPADCDTFSEDEL